MPRPPPILALSSPRFFNPLLLWADVLLKTTEMLLSSSAVIQLRTQRMAAHGLAPTPADLRELQRMGNEKLSAGNASAAAMANQLHTTGFALAQRAVRRSAQSAEAWAALASSATPAQALTRAQSWVDATWRATATATQLSGAAARMAQRGLKPIHATATANARRLSGAG